jgi:Tol biopolymer transport system component
MSNIPIANWSSDGRMVAFVIAGYRNEYNNILRLQIDSLNLTEVASADSVVRRLSWSSDNRYLHYSVFLDSWNEGPGYIVDTHTHTQQEICSAGYLFNAGNWIKDTDLMLYALQSPTSTRVELLDVSKWETQMLAELGPDSYVNLIGWTPITLP